ncbi:MAG: ATP-binding protein [Planctomycetota bacterium]|jgi:signal transduction histidine kinase|nr:ATP-binding protein [Planctomycetota bacterium]
MSDSNRPSEFGFALPVDEASRDRLAGLGQLAGSLVHELKNPLGAIELNMQMLRRQMDQGAFCDNETSLGKVDKRLGRIEQSTRHLRDIIESYLAFARPGRLVHDRVDLNEVIAEVIEQQQEVLARDKIEVVIKAEPGLRAVAADPHHLRQCLLNVIVNARDALLLRDSGRRLIIATRNRTDAVTVVLANNGPPLSDNAAAHLFDPFFSDKEGGTGLGLAIVSRLIEMHGGRIEVHSDPAQGVSFTIDLPTTLGLAKARNELPLPQREVEAQIHEATPSSGTSTTSQ